MGISVIYDTCIIVSGRPYGGLHAILNRHKLRQFYFYSIFMMIRELWAYK